MAGPTKTTPPAPDPKPGRNPGYSEPQPRDPDDARQPHPRKPPNPDEGGLERDPENGADPADR
ncbi:hypothetical protein [Lysobacter sp. 1R34A]|uniref:hypothetical protein n=1 Tax=Lysobacter sp. 1R34A TaxID=3445786 RepID=UPI003EEC36C1